MNFRSFKWKDTNTLKKESVLVVAHVFSYMNFPFNFYITEIQGCAVLLTSNKNLLLILSTQYNQNVINMNLNTCTFL